MPPTSEKESHGFYQYQPSALLRNFKELKLQENDNHEDAIPSSKRQRTSALLKSSSSSSSFVVAAVQFTATGIASSQVEPFLKIVEESIQMAAQEKGANLVLVPELFLGPYFCQSQEAALMELAFDDVERCPLVRRFQQLAKRLSIVLPVSLYERENNTLYNTVVMIDSDGQVLGKYRKSHIPDGTGYQEKFYFSPGDTGFQVWDTGVGKVGVGICWDQWFPEAARAMALQGADVLLYPTAIGTEPQDPAIDSSDHWQRVMQGHSAANMVPVVACNRVGTEVLLEDSNDHDHDHDNNHPKEKQRITFYGKSFITDETGKIISHADKQEEQKLQHQRPYTILTSTIYREKNRSTRLAWGLFRDRRPELYKVLLTKDGKK